MKSMQKALCAAKEFVSRRIVAASALIAAVALMMGYVSVNVRTITITDGDESHRIKSISTDSGVVLKAAGLTLEEDDSVTAEWEFNKGEIVIERAMDITVSVDGVTRTISMTEGIVADALKKAGVTLSDDDMVSLPLRTELTENMQVTVDRVTYKERTETESVAFGTTTYETDSYDKGEKVVEEEGENGEKQKIYRDRLVNGKVVESELIEEVITKEPVDKVIAVGTYVKPVVNKKPASSGGSTEDFSYSAVYRGEATAYTNENGAAGKYTASGMLAQVGVVAVNPELIPYGTKLYITTEDGSYTYGYCVAGDTGGFVYSNPNTIVDLFFDTLDECYKFGRRDVIVYVLD